MTADAMIATSYLSFGKVPEWKNGWGGRQHCAESRDGLFIAYKLHVRWVPPWVR